MKRERDINQLRIDANIHAKEKKFWLEKLAGELIKCQIPYSKAATYNFFDDDKNFNESLQIVEHIANAEDTNKLLNLCNGSDNKILMVLVTALNILLKKYSMHDDILIGTPLFKQANSEALLNKVVVLRNYVDDNVIVKDLILQVKDSIVAAFQNGNYPIEILFEQLNLDVNNNLCPLFDVGVIFENLQDRSYFNDLNCPLIFSFNRNGDELNLRLFYLTKLYTEQSINNLVSHFANVLNDLLKDINKAIKDINILNEEEKRHILTNLNNEQDKSIPDNVISVIYEQAQKYPEHIALKQNNVKIKYSDLIYEISKVSINLLKNGVGSGHLVGVVCERSLETIINLLGILRAGAGYVPIDPAYPEERINYIVEDSGIDLILAGTEIELNVKNCRIIKSNSLEDLNFIDADSDVVPNNVAYVIYTSGSTGKPKGVLVSHANLAAYVTAFNDEFQLSSNDVVLHQASLSFDISIEEIFPILTKGGCIIVSKREEILDQNKLASLLFDNKVNLISVSPLLLNEINKIPLEKLKHLQTCISGGDVLKKEYYNNLIKISNVYNTYGPTESTVCITYYKCKLEDEKEIPIGRPIKNYKVYILDSCGELLPIGVPGEICVAGPGVTKGYLNNILFSSEKFIDNPFEKHEKVYRTGDLGLWSEDGNIYFKGRIDHQVKIRGYRVELEEIENELMSLDDIQEVVVLDKEDKNGTKFLYAYYVPVNAEMDLKETMKRFLSEKLPDFMVPSNFIKLDKIPFTINGKVDRKALLKIEIEELDSFVAPASEIEKNLASILSSVLENDNNEIGVNSDFFELGGHSLKAMVLLSKIHNEYGVKIPLESFFNAPTINGLVNSINTLPKERCEIIKTAERKPYYQLSSAQKRLYLLQQMDPTSNFYNIPYIMEFDEKIEKERIQEVFIELIDRHESFRTSFNIINEVPVQIIHGQVDFQVKYQKIIKNGVEKIKDEFSKPFDLSKAPILKVEYIDIEGSGSMLMIDMHHIISDAVSHQILENEFLALYSGKELLPLKLQYKDYSEWQNSEEQQKRIKTQENYWLNKLKGDLPVLDLPTDYVRPIMQNHEGATVNFLLDAKKTKQVREFTEKTGITLYMLILSVFNILLSKLSGHDDIIVGTPVAGRSHIDFNKIIGMFVNVLPIRSTINNDLTIKEYLKYIKQLVLECFDNQNYQFEELVEKLSVERDTSRNPVFDVLFNLIKRDDIGLNAPEIDNLEYGHVKGISKYDLNLSAIDFGEYIILSYEYCFKLFKSETIDRFITYTFMILDQLIHHSDKKISEIKLLTEEQEQKLLMDINNAKREYPVNKTIYDLFEEQSSLYKDEVAIKFNGNKLTYVELNQLAGQVSNMLIDEGVFSGSIIAIEQYRSVEMVTCIFGILKAGCTYLPIDPDYPEERKRYILSDSKADFIIKSKEINSEQFSLKENLLIENISGEFSEDSKAEDVGKPAKNAYIIYTSGSTGKPKGVVVGHKSVVNLLYGLQDNYPITRNNSYLFKTSYCFDVSIAELFGWMLGGGSMTILEKGKENDPEAIINVIDTQEVTHVNFVPSMFKTFSGVLDEKNKDSLKSLKYIFIAGEALTRGHIDGFQKLKFGIKIENLYGPTEATVYSSMYSVDIENKASEISIGKGVINSELYVLNKTLGEQPFGVPGELHIGGCGLAIGYLNNPELTHDKFIDSPFENDSKLYSSGDLVRRRSDGNIDFLGRIDHQVKVRGFRIELGEIESRLSDIKEIKEVVVVDLSDNEEDKYLCAYLVCSGKINELEIRKRLEEDLPAYMIPSYFVKINSIPLTANGKVNRKALPKPEVNAGIDYVAPENDVERKMVEVWSQVLNIKEEEISTNADFFRIGGHSLKATILINRLRTEFQIEIYLKEIFKYPTVKGLASFIKTNQNGNLSDLDLMGSELSKVSAELIDSNLKSDQDQKTISTFIPKAKLKERYDLSSAQRRFYLLQQLDTKSIAYNIPLFIPLGKETDINKIEEVFKQLVIRHESYRTSIIVQDEIPYQIIHNHIDFQIERYKRKKSELNDFKKEIVRPFDLTKAPLIRVAIVDILDGDYLLVMDMHHIISDDFTHIILKEEFTKLYSGEPLEQQLLQYKDYSEWQNSKEQQKKIKKEEKYWLDKFKGNIPVLELPTDFNRPIKQSFDGALVNFLLNEEEKSNLRLLEEREGVTLYMAMLTVFNVLLSKLSGQNDIIIGTPFAGRNHIDFEKIVGVFVNTVAIRNEIWDNLTLKQNIERIKDVTIEAFDNQSYPFEELVEKVAIDRDAGRNPLFDVMFDVVDRKSNNGNESFGFLNKHIKTISKFDLSLSVIDFEDQIALSFEYSTKLFKEKTINRFIKYITYLIKQIPEIIDRKIGDIELLMEEDKKQITHFFNGKKDRNKIININNLINEQTYKYPERIALVQRDNKVTYAEMIKRANQVANYLLDQGISSGSIVGVIGNKSIDTIINVIGVLKTGAGYLPIDPIYPKERINYLLKDSGVELLLVNNVYDNSLLDDCKLVSVDTIFNYNFNEVNIDIAPEDIAYIIYTSGTTGKPKGVVITHLNLATYVSAFNDKFELCKEDVFLHQASLSFDMSIEEIFPILTKGGSILISSKEEILDRNVLSYSLLNNKVSLISVSPLLLNEINNIPKKYLKHIHTFISGGDVLKKEYYDNLIEVGNVYNTYGPTESTVCVSYNKCEIIDDKFISIGKPIQNYNVYILGKKLELAPIGVRGEICVAGPGVGRGYLNNIDLTSEKFTENPFDKDKVIYKTGDLGYWSDEGKLFFSGRVDDQVKIRGYRVELEEIEKVLQSHKNINDCIILALGEFEEKYLCAYYTYKFDESYKLDIEDLKKYLRNKLPDYMVPSYFMSLKEIPLTTTGKVDKRKLPLPQVEVGANFMIPSNPIEERLVGIWSDILKIQKDKISVNESFFSLGGHSLRATSLVFKIYEEFHVEFSLQDIFIYNKINEQAQQIELKEQKNYFSIPKSKEKEYYNLSSAQKRLYLLQQMDLRSTAYNMPILIDLPLDPDKGRILNTFRMLIERHENFRTTFEMINEVPVQKIYKDVEFDISEYIIEEQELENRKMEFICSFDLSKAPLLRAEILKIKGGKSILQIDMHHIISDGLSHEILKKEFFNIYEGRALAPLKLQYKDYAEWQNSNTQKIKMQKQEDFWVNKLAGQIPVLNLPMDYSRPALQSHKGAEVGFVLPEKVTTNLRSLIEKEGVTLYMLLLAAFNVLLSKLTLQDDLIIGTPIAGRNHSDLENIVGMFVNTLALRFKINKDFTIKELLDYIKKGSIEAFEHQDYQFEDLVEKLSITRDISRNPIFDVLFNLLQQEDFEGDFTQLEANNYKHFPIVSKFDLSFVTIDYGKRLVLGFIYCTELFTPETIESYIRYLNQIIEQFIDNIDKKVSEVSLLSEIDKRKILNKYNPTSISSSIKKTIVELFEEQVEKEPDHIALVYEGKKISYNDLNVRSNLLARFLQKQGVVKESIVGLMVERTEEMIVGMLGILKAGAAYLPISPEYPKERISFIISESKTKLLLIDNNYEQVEGVSSINLKNIDLRNEDHRNLEKVSSPDNLSYVIYTSGSTGRPKGVMIDHKSCLNSILWYKLTYNIEEGSNILQSTNFTFDPSVQQIFSTLLSGGKLHLFEDKWYSDIESLVSYIKDEEIELIHFVPTFLKELVSNLSYIKTLKSIISGGEKLENNLKDKILDKGYNLYNHYGPTEASITAVSGICNKESISIGRPLPNTHIYIISNEGEIQPPGVWGEICISGAGLARGYLNNDKLTKERFVDNPYVVGSKMYKTGDLGRWLLNGEIEFLGRKDDQIKLNGYRIELGEIESVLSQYGGIVQGAVVLKDQGNNKFLCAYYSANNLINEDDLKGHIFRLLPKYMVPAKFVRIEEFPLTSGGKVDKRILSEIEEEIEQEFELTRNQLDQKLIEIWSDVLDLGIDKISIATNFFDLGGHSLKAMIITGRLRKELKVEVSLLDFFRYSCIKDLSDHISTLSKLDFVSIKPARNQEYYFLSSAQRRLFFLNQLTPNSIAYNMPHAFKIQGNLDIEYLEISIMKLISRHESLRTSINEIEKIPVQKIYNNIDFKIEYYEEYEESKIEKLVSDFVRPFDLNVPGFLRVGLIKKSVNEFVLVYDIHHIISDMISRQVLDRDLITLLSGKDLPELSIQYKDFSVWQNSKEIQKRLSFQKEYWMHELSGDLTILNLPYDYPRPNVQTFEGGHLNFKIDEKQTQLLKEIVRTEGTTLFTVLFSCFNIFLSKLSGQEDILIGIPVSGRNHADLEEVVGMFVNTIATRSHINGELTLREFINKTHIKSLKSYSNQDYPLEDLLDSIGVERDISRNPLFDVVFVLQQDNIIKRTNRSEIDGLEITPYPIGNQTTKFDLTLSCVESEEEIYCSFEYASRLFKPATINRFISGFLTLLNNILSNVEAKIKEVSLLTDNEKSELLLLSNKIKFEGFEKNRIISLFEEQVLKSPERIAVVCKDISLTYSELNAKSDLLAKNIKSKGSKNGDIIGIMSDSSPEMLIGILGILKANCIYVPIATDLPSNRVEYILKDCNVNILLLDAGCNYQTEVCEVYKVSDLFESNIDISLDGQDTKGVYIIYTSGSTGLPKGVLIENESLINLCLGHNSYYNITSNDNLSKYAGFGFDASVWEIFPGLISGAKLVLVTDEIKLDAERLSEFYNKIDITVSFLPTQICEQFIKYNNKSLRILLTGGDKLNSFVERDYDLYNNYGPTEATVVTTRFKVEKNYNNIPIGNPIENTDVVILDSNNAIQPIGVAGELCISGVSLSVGYINNQELTNEKFIDHPYKEGEKLYKTGDLARLLEDGNIEFLGRIDTQVKIRGFRIELGEIENLLLKHKKVKECIVNIFEKDKEKYLCAYIIFNKKIKSNLKNYLQDKLPEYMIPQFFIELEEFPLTSNGKVNRKMLPVPDLKADNDYIAPRTETEKKLVAIWSETLNVPEADISINANFFNLGGHSLKTSICINSINNSFNTNIPLIEIFKAPTIAQLSCIVENDTSNNKNNRINLILLKEGKNKNRNVFLIHDGSGEVDGYVEFCKQADDDVNYWGIKAAGLKRIEPFNIELEEIAKEYLNIINAVENNGVYNIIGWSLGGTIAYEIVRLLENNNKTVGFFGIIDSVPPQMENQEDIEPFSIKSEYDWTSSFISNKELIGQFDNSSDLENFWGKLTVYLEKNSEGNELIKNEIIKNIGFEIYGYKDLELKELIKYLNFVRSLNRSCKNYTPKNFINSEIYYFAAKISKDYNKEYWNGFSKKCIIRKEIDGDHHTIMKDSNVKELFKNFKYYFEKKQEEKIIETV